MEGKFFAECFSNRFSECFMDQKLEYFERSMPEIRSALIR